MGPLSGLRIDAVVQSAAPSTIAVSEKHKIAAEKHKIAAKTTATAAVSALHRALSDCRACQP